MKDHEVAEGECFSSIAFENGFFWRTLWEHEKNAGLKAKTRSPFVLEPGSVVHVPDPRPKEEACATGKRHRFRRKGVPEVLNILFAEGGEPLAGVPFVLVIDGQETHGKTDDEGRVRQWLAPNAAAGTLTLHPPNAVAREYRLGLRRMDPAEGVTGQKARLANLGFYDGPVDGEPRAALAEAIRAFQRSAGLSCTGEADAATIDALVRAHKS